MCKMDDAINLLERAKPDIEEAQPSVEETLENDDAHDAVLQLMGHEAEVSKYGALNPAANYESIRSSFVLGTLLNTIY